MSDVTSAPASFEGNPWQTYRADKVCTLRQVFSYRGIGLSMVNFVVTTAMILGEAGPWILPKK